MALFVASLRFAGGPSLPLAVDCLVYATIFLFVMGVVRSLHARTLWRPGTDARTSRCCADTLATVYDAGHDGVGRRRDCSRVRRERTTDHCQGRTRSVGDRAWRQLTAVMVGVTAAVHLGVAAGGLPEPYSRSHSSLSLATLALNANPAFRHQHGRAWRRERQRFGLRLLNAQRLASTTSTVCCAVRQS